MYLPWYNYKFYGDDTIVKEYYEEMRNLTNFYLDFKGENGIMQDGMGDWCPPRWDRRKNFCHGMRPYNFSKCLFL
ncbi:alpha-L-rhamnosidase-related protein [Jejuia pallidilutea]|nr:hypothetical protein [Jejuia pallidilutea]